MKLNAKGTVESFVGRKLIYNKIITRKLLVEGGALDPPLGTYVCMYICMYVYNVCMYLCMYVCLYVRICVYLRMYVT